MVYIGWQLVYNLQFSSPAFPLGWEVFHQEILFSWFHWQLRQQSSSLNNVMQLRVYPCSYLSALRSLPSIEAPAIQLLPEQTSCTLFGFSSSDPEGFFYQSSAHPSKFRADIVFDHSVFLRSLPRVGFGLFSPILETSLIDQALVKFHSSSMYLSRLGIWGT